MVAGDEQFTTHRYHCQTQVFCHVFKYAKVKHWDTILIEIIILLTVYVFECRATIIILMGIKIQ